MSIIPRVCVLGSGAPASAAVPHQLLQGARTRPVPSGSDRNERNRCQQPLGVTPCLHGEGAQSWEHANKPMRKSSNDIATDEHFGD